jgi:hypothetical protein
MARRDGILPPPLPLRVHLLCANPCGQTHLALALWLKRFIPISAPSATGQKWWSTESSSTKPRWPIGFRSPALCQNLCHQSPTPANSPAGRTSWRAWASTRPRAATSPTAMTTRAWGCGRTSCPARLDALLRPEAAISHLGAGLLRDALRQAGPGPACGSVLTVEGGLGGTFLKGGRNVSVAYGAQWKITEDSGDDFPSAVLPGKKHSYTIGPEASLLGF